MVDVLLQETTHRAAEATVKRTGEAECDTLVCLEASFGASLRIRKWTNRVRVLNLRLAFDISSPSKHG
jgi:hypothetical protein